MQNYSNSTQTVQLPSVNIAVNNNRKKRYTSTNSKTPIYYLHSGQQFQIELFNPTTDIIKAMISLNGKPISGGGLVLKPGTRVFLDRYLDSPRKFKFETYTVNGNNKTVQKAIENNGSVTVKFYKQYIPFNSYPCITTNCNSTWTTNSPYLSSHITNFTGNLNYTDTITTDTTNTVNFSSVNNISNSNQLSTKSSSILSKKASKIETGMIGKGSESNQKFTNVQYEFEYFPFHTVNYKILPISQQQITSETLNITRYCTQCGSKIKKQYRFCPKCGTKC